MKVILHQIGPFPHLELKILDTGLICLSGASGTGKSSLLRAITWIITGEPKREIINLYAKTKEKVWGSIEYKTLKIHRQKRPDKLQVITVKSRSGKELILEDDAAQHYLNNTFGVNSVIFASSYLAQKSAHPLLDLGITDRLDLIQNLVWSMDNPNVYIDRVEEKIKNISLEIKILSPEFEKEYKAWKKRKRACNVQNFTEPGPIRSQISEAETQITTLESQVAKLNKIRGKLENTRDQLRKIHIGEYPPISQLESTRESLKAELVLCTKIKKISEINSQLEKYPETNIDPEKYVLKEILKIETKYAEQQKLCKKLELPYTPEAITSAQQQAKKDTEYYKYESAREKIHNLEGNLKTPKYSVEEIQKLKICSTLYKCPECQVSLQISGEKLVAIKNLEPITIHLDLDMELKIAKKYASDTQLLTSLKSSIPELSPPIYNKKQIPEIEKLKFIPVPEITSIQLENAIQRKQLLGQLELLGAVESIDIRPISEISEELKKLQKTIDAAVKSETDKTQFTELKLTETQLEQELKEYTGIESKLKSEKLVIKELNAKLEELAVIKSVMETGELLGERKQYIKTLNRQLRMLGNIKEKMIQVEYDRLQESIETIEVVTNEILTKIFEEPIQIEINLYKEVKSTHIKKPSINLIYTLNGMKTENTKFLSGGQLDRISIALLLAFAQIGSLPWLLIDEYLASLNGELREKVREIIREKCSDKVIIISSHNDDTSFYDDIIDMENVDIVVDEVSDDE